ncbi:hypothetical protein HZS_3774, partial [Henneguya salminicola]
PCKLEEFTPVQIKLFKLFTRKAPDTHVYELKDIPSGQIKILYIFSWTDDTYKGINILDMVDRLKTMSGYNMLKPKYTTISSPLEIELNHLSPCEGKMVIEMFRLAHNTITSNKKFDNIVTKQLSKDNLELILFISSSDTIPLWSVALRFDNKDRKKPKVLYVMILDKAYVTDDVAYLIIKHFSDIILSPIAVSSPPALKSENFSPQTDTSALFLSSSAPPTEDSKVKGGSSLPILSPTAPTTEDHEVKGGPSFPLPSPTAPTAEDSEVKDGPSVPSTNSSTVPTPSHHNEEDSKKTMIIIIVAVISTLVLIGIIGFVSYYCLKIQGENKLKNGLTYQLNYN